MKKSITLLLAVFMLLSVFFTGCHGTKVVWEEGVHYSQEFVEGGYDTDSKKETNPVFNTDIFYKNIATFSCADPFAYKCIDESDTENYGKYFLFGTTITGVFNCFESTDLVTWEKKSGAYTWPTDGWQHSDCWAPEIIWDEFANPTDYGLEDDPTSSGVYFMFSSASPWYEIETESNEDYEMVLDLAVATKPYGPYIKWNGNEKGAIIDGVDYSKAENFAKYTVYSEESDLYAYVESSELNQNGNERFVSRLGDTIDNDDTWWNSPAAQASLQYQWEHKDLAGQVDPDTGKTVPEGAANFVVDEGYSWMSSLDPTPFLDYNEMVTVNGVSQPKKYLFFTRERPTHTGNQVLGTDGELAFPGTCVYVVSFINNDWSQIDYNSLTRVTRNRFNFISQAAADSYYEQAEAFDAESFVKGFKETTVKPFGTATAEEYARPGNYINEGSQVNYNPETGLYYLTISVGVYYNTTYSVIQLVAYRPYGPWRKLDLDEGGLTLSTNDGKANDIVTGPGHHTTIQVGDELAFLYHQHVDLTKSMHQRGPTIDRVVWVKNSEGMTVMHVNGPSTYLQPKLYGTGATEYDIISDEAEVNVKGKKYNDVKYLTDGVIPIHFDEIQSYIHEFEFTSDEAEITLKFDDYRQVVALMVFNSKDYDKTFLSVDRIEMDIKKDGVKCTAVINDLQFNWDANLFSLTEDMRPGGSATAVFDEVAVKEIRITIQNNGYEGVTAIPEIYVLGRPNA